MFKNAFSQTLMQQRPEIDWKKLSSENFDVVYPDGHKEIATRVINLLEHYRDEVSFDYKVDVEKITLILHDKTSDSNGFVTLGPRRSEWYMTPALFRELGSTEWYNTLSVHEFRHVVQFQKMTERFNRFFYFIFGDSGLSLGMALSAPAWYFEGDAVVTETVHTKAGRGRSADFSMLTRSILLEEKSIDYETLFMPNYNHALPNHYEYGYFSHANFRNKYGPNAINHLIDESIRDSYWPFTYYNSYPLVIGKKFLDYHHETLMELHTKLNEEEKNNQYTSSETLLGAAKEKGFTSIDQFKVSDDGIYLIKKDFDSITALYHLENKELKHITDLQYLPHYQRASFGKSKLIYTQQQPVTRYLFESTSDLYLVDLKSGDQEKLTSGKVLFQPSFSSDEKEIFAIEQNDESRFELARYSLSGEKLNSYTFKNIYPSYPQSQDANTIFLITQRMDGKKAVSRFNIETKTLKELTPYSWNPLSNLKLIEGNLYFERDFKGKIEVTKLDLKTLKESILTSSKVAARSPYVFKNELYYLDFTRYGYELKKTNAPLNKSFSIKEIEESNKGKIATDFIKESKEMAEAQSLTKEYEVKDFSRFKNLFNFHSWTLLPLPSAVTLQATSTNYLNTMSLSTGYSYSAYEESNAAFFGFSYLRYWPVLSINTSWAQRRTFEDSDHEVRTDAWEETMVQGLVTLPFVLNFNTFTQNLLVSGGWNLLETTSRDDNETYEPTNNTLSGPTFEVSYSLTKNMALRDINPSFGINLKTLNRKVETEKGNELSGHQDIYSASLFLPGLGNNHSIMLSSSLEKQKSFTDYRFETLIRKTRGSDYDFAPTLNVSSFDYFFPIAYPDLSFSRWYYLSRVYASVFYDYGELKNDNFFEIRSSAGVDVYLESRFIRLLPLTFGIRGAKMLEDGETVTELFLKTDVQF